MRTTTVEKLIWVLIYGGIFALSIGFFIARTDIVFGTVLQLGGALAVVVGIFLIWLRSRMIPPAK
jgi:hypothetical protein